MSSQAATAPRRPVVTERQPQLVGNARQPQPIRASPQRVVILGCPGVGKTSLTQCILGQDHPSIPSLPSTPLGNQAALGPLPTVGVDFATRAVSIDGQERPARLHIFDASGQARFKDVVESYLSTLDNYDAVIVAYDVTNRATFEEVDRHIRRVRCLAKGLPQIALVGMKADLAQGPDGQTVSSEDAQAIAEELQVRITVQIACPPCQQDGGRDVDSNDSHETRSSQRTVDAILLRPLLQQCSDAMPSSACPAVVQQRMRAHCPPPAVIAAAPTSCSSEAEAPMCQCSHPIRRCFGFA